MSKNKRTTQKKRLSGDSLFALIVVLCSILLLAVIIFFGKEEKAEPVEQETPTQLDTSNQVTVGDPNAPVEVVQFFDFQCPHCQEWDQSVFPGLNKSYIESGKIKYTLINFPFLGEQSEKSALLFETINGVAGSDEALAFKQTVFKSIEQANDATKAFYDKELMNAAEKVVTPEQFSQIKTSYKNKEFAPALDIDANLVNAHNVAGTPAVFVNSQFIEDGANPDAVFAAIDQALENNK